MTANRYSTNCRIIEWTEGCAPSTDRRPSFATQCQSCRPNKFGVCLFYYIIYPSSDTVHYYMTANRYSTNCRIIEWTEGSGALHQQIVVRRLPRHATQATSSSSTSTLSLESRVAHHTVPQYPYRSEECSLVHNTRTLSSTKWLSIAIVSTLPCSMDICLERTWYLLTCHACMHALFYSI
jgi:hypothetical protein